VLTALAAGAAAALLLGAVLYPGAFPWSLPLLLLVVPLAEIALTPVWRAAGVYRYHSPLLFSVRRGQREVELHAGTAHDYLLRFRWADRGTPAQRVLLRELLQGLLAVADEAGAGRMDPATRITIASHAVGPRTARRIGFETVPAGVAERVHLVVNVVGIAAMYGFVRGRPAMPRVWRARGARIRADALARAAPRIRALLERLDARPGHGERDLR
jgi:hypothetical protein